MAISEDAKNKEARAPSGINYIETPQVHAAITNEVYYRREQGNAENTYRKM